MALPARTIRNSSFLTQQKVDKTNYTSNVLPNNPESTLFKEIISRTFVTTFYDSLVGLKKRNGLHIFFEGVNKFGKGERVISLGLNNINDFSGSPDQRFPTTHNQVSDYEFQMSTLVRLMQRLTLSDVQWMRYFKDKQGFSEFKTKYRDAFYKSWVMFFQTFFLNIFGSIYPATKFSEIANSGNQVQILPFVAQPASVHSDKDVEPTIDVISKNVRKALRNNVKYVDDLIDPSTKSTSKSVNLIRTLALLVSQLNGVPTADFNIGLNANGQYVNIASKNGDLVDGHDPLWHNISTDSLIVVGSVYDKNEYERNYLSGVYNRDEVMYPAVGQYIWLPIPPGEMYVMEKQAFVLKTHFEANSSQYHAMDLTTDIISHNQFYVNFFPYAFGFLLSSATPTQLAAKVTKTDPLQKTY